MKKPHKFFEKYLDNDLEKLSKELQIRYDFIDKNKNITPNDIWKASNSVSTIKWREYNVFQFHIDEIYNLYSAVSDLTKEACEYYGIDFYEQQYMIQGWFNINYNKKGKLDWHDHGPNGAPNFHGYYCVNAEPSITHYKIDGIHEVENINKNNRAILSEMTHPHAMADWDWDGPRITVAYDLLPLQEVKKVFSLNDEQHWIPLL
jgi:hypothetical protein